jgi:PAS domain S-box-containing protein
MRFISSRSVLAFAIVLAVLVLAIELWKQNVALWAPLWVLQIVLLAFAALLMTRETRARRKALADLRRSEERFAKIFDYSPAGIALSRQADGCYLEVNDSYARLTGYTRAELIGHTSTELGILAAANRNAFLASVRERGHARGFDLQMVTKSAEPIDVYSDIELVDFNGETCLLSSVVDIRERKRMERELRRLNDELEGRVARRTADLAAALADQQRALKLKDEFLAMVSHELRTPLTGVLAMAEILAGELSGPLTARQSVYIKSIQASGQRLLEIVNSILGYTQLIAGEVELARQSCRLAYLLDTAAASPRGKAAAKQQALELQVDPPELAVTTDPGALVQVIRRLLDNAVKFTPPGGSVGVLAHPVPSAACVRIVVWDTGIGVAPADLAKIVKPFTQGDGSLSRHHEGVGMGLAYVDRMLPLLGGCLDLEPNSDGGSRFVVTLPT